jgi:hypothetical protein
MLMVCIERSRKTLRLSERLRYVAHLSRSFTPQAILTPFYRPCLRPTTPQTHSHLAPPPEVKLAQRKGSLINLLPSR